MTAQVDTWSTLAIGPDFTVAAVTFFLGISALYVDDSSVQNFFEWGAGVATHVQYFAEFMLIFGALLCFLAPRNDFQSTGD